MPFVTVIKHSHGGSISGIRMGGTLQSNNTPRGIYLALSVDVVEQVGWPVEELPGGKNQRRVTRIAIREGVGDDRGYWMFVHDPKGYTIGSDVRVKHTFAGQIGITRIRHYVMNELPTPIVSCEFAIDSKAQSILITLPDWLRYNPQSYKEPEAAADPIPLRRRRRA